MAEIGKLYRIKVPKRGASQQWETLEFVVMLVDEVPLCQGNQRLFKMEHEDGTKGTVWESQLLSLE